MRSGSRRAPVALELVKVIRPAHPRKRVNFAGTMREYWLSNTGSIFRCDVFRFTTDYEPDRDAFLWTRAKHPAGVFVTLGDDDASEGSLAIRVYDCATGVKVYGDFFDDDQLETIEIRGVVCEETADTRIVSARRKPAAPARHGGRGVGLQREAAHVPRG